MPSPAKQVIIIIFIIIIIVIIILFYHEYFYCCCYYYYPKGFAPCRRPPRPTGKERDSIAFVVVDAAAVAAAAAAVVVFVVFFFRFSLLDAEWGAGMISSLSSGVVAGSRCLHVGDAGVKSLWGVSRWRM